VITRAVDETSAELSSLSDSAGEGGFARPKALLWFWLCKCCPNSWSHRLVLFRLHMIYRLGRLSYAASVTSHLQV
jgi:hypothetical protein